MTETHTIVVPHKSAEGRLLDMASRFLWRVPSVDKALLEKGFHVVFYDMAHLYGSPRAMKLGTDFIR